MKPLTRRIGRFLRSEHWKRNWIWIVIILRGMAIDKWSSNGVWHLGLDGAQENVALDPFRRSMTWCFFSCQIRRLGVWAVSRVWVFKSLGRRNFEESLKRVLRMFQEESETQEWGCRGGSAERWRRKSRESLALPPHPKNKTSFFYWNLWTDIHHKTRGSWFLGLRNITKHKVFTVLGILDPKPLSTSVFWNSELPNHCKATGSWNSGPKTIRRQQVLNI